MAKAAPGFYDDGQGRMRYFDGKMWTDQYQDASRDAQPSVATEVGLLWSSVGKPITGIGAGRYRLTKDMLSFEKGTLSLKAQHILTHEIHDVDVTQSMTQKVRGVGDVTLWAVRSTGREQVVLEDIPDFRVAAAKLNEVAAWARDKRLTKESTSTVNYVGLPTGAISAPAAGALTTMDLNAEITKLAAFREQGVLDEDEFKAAKAKLLGL